MTSQRLGIILLDDEITAILAGWALVFTGGSLTLWAVMLGGVGIGWTLLVVVGIWILVHSFIKWRLPELIKFVKNKEWENEWTRSLGL